VLCRIPRKGDEDVPRPGEYDARVKLAAAGAVLLLALGGGAAARAATPSSFQTPSGNIGCIYVGPFASIDRPYLRCDIGGGLHPLPPRPRNCDLDWGYGYSMSDTGRATTFCAGDTAKDPRAPILRYGRTWHKGPFTCVSQRIGLRCANRARRGFFLSRQHSYTF
jgi:hypothetical protein